MSGNQTSRTNHRKLFIFAIVAVLLATMVWYIDNHVSIEEMARQESRFRSIIALNPWRSFFVGFGIYLGLALVPGTGGKAIVYGWLFGFWQAVIIVSVGLTIAAMAIFTLSRYLFQESIERRYTSILSIMNRHLEKEGAFYLLTLRLSHVPYSVVNPVSGASRVSTWTFFWTTVVGLFPVNLIWVYVGMNLPSLQELVNSGPGAFIDTPLILALVASATLPLLTRWLINYFKLRGSAKREHAATIHKSRRKIR